MSSRPLRVLHLLGELRPSGAETMLAAAAPAFAARGIAGEILSTGSVPGRFAERLAAAGYPVHHIPFSKSPVFFLRLARLVRGFDVLHVHAERASFWTSLTAMLVGVRTTVRTVHSAFLFSGGLRVRRLVQRRLLGWLGVHFVAISRSVQETEQGRFGVAALLVPNWFDATRFRPPTGAERAEARVALGIGSGEMVLVSVGNCSPLKNHGVLLEALARIPADRRPLYLHVGEEEPGSPERQRAEVLRLGHRARFLGALADVSAVLHAADGFVMPSKVEGLGISALEAIATGLPAILSDVSGLRDLAAHFPGVRLVPPRAEALAEALEAFLAEPEASRRAAAGSWPELARQAFGLTAGVEQYVALYRGSSH